MDGTKSLAPEAEEAMQDERCLQLIPHGRNLKASCYCVPKHPILFLQRLSHLNRGFTSYQRFTRVGHRIRQRSRFPFCIASQLVERESLADDTIHRHTESFAIRQLAVVVPKRLLIQVTEQVKWFDGDIGSVDAALEADTKSFQDRWCGPGHQHIGRRGPLLDAHTHQQAVVGYERIGVERGPGFDMLLDFGLERLLLAIRNYYGAHLAATLKDSHDCGFVLAACAGDSPLPLADVHVAGLTADECFVSLDLTGQLRRSLPKAQRMR